jgi:hypothetical protein
MLARRSNLLSKPPVVAKVEPRPEPVRRLEAIEKPKRKARDGEWWRMSKPQREALVRKMWAADGSIRGFARAVGVTHQAVENMARRLGLPPRNRATGGEPA